MKKIFTFFLALVASVGMTFAESGTCGTNLTWDLTDGVLTISGTGAMTDYSSVSKVPWYSYRDSITSLKINYGTTRIGENAFYGCTGLTSIDIPNSVTSIKYQAFCNCANLDSLTIPYSVTSIKSDAFNGCSGLTSIIVESGNKEYSSPNNCNAIISSGCLILGCKNTIIPNTVTSIGSNAFYGCTGLTSIDIPNSVTAIRREAFYGCTGLTSIGIPNSVVSIGQWAFEHCANLDSLTIPSSVTEIEDLAFRGCSGLTSIIVESGNKHYNSRNNCNAIISTVTSRCLILGCKNTIIPDSVEKINKYAFYGCEGLSHIEFPNSLKEIGEGAFYGCSGLTSIATNRVTAIGNDAFFGCSGLTSIEIGSSLMNLWNRVFGNCSSLKSISVNRKNNTYLRSGCNVIVADKSKCLLVGCKNSCIPNEATSIGPDAFYGCTGLTSIVIPNSITSIGSDAFYGCTGLTSIDIPNSVTAIGPDAFYGCTGLTSVTCEAITPPTMSTGVFDQVECSKIPLYVPAESVTAYKEAEQWKDFNPILPIATEHTITFVNWDGTTLLELPVEEGVVPEYTGATPTRPETAEFTYTFTGWTPKIVAATKDATYTATYTSTRKSYTITWLQDDGSLIDKTTVVYGQTPTHANPTKPETAEYKYVFAGWSPKIVAVTGDATYSARYNAIPIEQDTVATEEEKDVEVAATPTEEGSVILEWPAEENAATYTITIAKNGEIICTLVFDAEGRLISIAFAAPARDGNGRNVPAAEKAAKGWRYEVKGLEPNTQYTYTVTATCDETVLYSETIDFTMPAPQGIDDINADTNVQKLVRDNQVLILRGEKTYTVTGQEIK